MPSRVPATIATGVVYQPFALMLNLGRQALLTGPGRLDGRVERQEVRLVCHGLDQAHHRADAVGHHRELLDLAEVDYEIDTKDVSGVRKGSTASSATRPGALSCTSAMRRRPCCAGSVRGLRAGSARAGMAP